MRILFSFENILLVQTLTLLLYVVDIRRSDDQVGIVEVFEDNLVFIFIVEEYYKLFRRYVTA